jgi:hypothetical protein
MKYRQSEYETRKKFFQMYKNLNNLKIILLYIFLRFTLEFLSNFYINTFKIILKVI